MGITKIEWAHRTVNLWTGCHHQGPECDHCYAEQMYDNPRSLFRRGLVQLGGERASEVREAQLWGAHAPRPIFKGWRASLKKYAREARRAGQPLRIFVESLGDLFETLPENNTWRWHVEETRDEFFELAEQLSELRLLLLTKRPSNVRRMVPAHWMTGSWPDHVWMGVTFGRQDMSHRVDELVQLPARIRFLSCEPMLGLLDLFPWFIRWNLQWVIAGGESGKHARPMQLEWARQLRDQCVRESVPFFFKQWGEYAPDADGHMRRVGKKTAGRLLDGREWSEVPNL